VTISKLDQTQILQDVHDLDNHRLKVDIGGAAKTNVTKRWGLYSDTNGFFIQQTGTGLSVVYRTNITGSVVNTIIDRASWNLDKLDGTGPSGFNLDVTKGAVFLLEYTWHGAGRVRFGVKAAKANIYFHEFDFDNSQTYTYSRNPYQPIKAEIINTASTASATELHVHTISAYVHNHKQEAANIIFSASRGVTYKTMAGGVYRPLLSIRPALLFNSRINRVTVEPLSCQVFTTNNPLNVQLILNPTTITGASWVLVNSASAVKFDIAATAYTGGTIVQEFYVPANTDLITGAAPGTETSQIGSFPLGLSIDGTTQDVLMVVARSLAGNTDTVANINWKEYQ
jgi:hypothetical protein